MREHLDRADDPRAAAAYLAAARAEAAALRVDSALRLLQRGGELDAPGRFAMRSRTSKASSAATSATRRTPIAAFERALAAGRATTRSAAPRISALPPRIA